MNPKVNAALDAVPLKTVKASLKGSEATLNSIEGAGDTIQKALIRAGISQKEAALTMDVNEGQLTRQLRGQEHLSWQRLFKLPDRFWRELLVVLAERRGLATVRMQLDFDQKVG